MSGAAPQSVLVVLDPEAGEGLLAWRKPNEPVWIVESPANDPVIAALSAQSGAWSAGVTSFPADPNGDLETNFRRLLAEIELHHTPHDGPAFTELRVVGLALGAPIQSALREAGFDRFEAGPSGFVARSE